jgi:hypothetical protein
MKFEEFLAECSDGGFNGTEKTEIPAHFPVRYGSRDPGCVTREYGQAPADLAVTRGVEFVASWRSTEEYVHDIETSISAALMQPGDSFLGVDRSFEPVRLSGARYPAPAIGGQAEWQGAILELAGKLHRVGAHRLVFLAPPWAWAVGHAAPLGLAGPMGLIRFCLTALDLRRAYLLEPESWVRWGNRLICVKPGHNGVFV